MNSKSSSTSRKTEDGTRQKTSMAQRRWRLLARALTRSPEPPIDIEDEEISVRRFTSFGLVKPSLLENAPADPESSWYEYSCVLEHELFVAQVRRINKTFTANELIGFNNTGNVCVWPSEECLAYYLLSNQPICRNKKVLELGGGMSCLAGIFVAKYCGPAGVTLTDGNVTSVDNVRCIVARNNMEDLVQCGVVQWARAATALRQVANGNRVQTWISDVGDESRRTDGLYDVILSADCLFFDDVRLDLVETIYGWLADDGIALMMAPRRGSTFQKFAEAAVKRGFLARQSERYDARVWSRHLELLQLGHEYSIDLHYPVLADYWKSQGRKFCDFCKCWIADNKPSIEFHEGGKKHKENVSKRLKEIHKNSAKQAKINKKFENDIKNMEDAAMAAYLKDVEGNAVDLTAQQILRDKHKKNDDTTNANHNPNRMPAAAPETNPRHKLSQNLPADVDFCDPTTFYRARVCPTPRNINPPNVSGENKAKGKVSREKRKGKRGNDDDCPNKKSVSKLWYEARSPEGYTYYWHVETNETSWEPPEEGFMTFGEQEAEVKEQEIQAEFLDQIEQEEANKKAEILEEQRANAERERLKELRKQHNKKKNNLNEKNEEEIKVKEEEKEESNDEIPYRRDYTIPEHVGPYGPWQTIEIKPKKIVDLQLPKKEVIQVIQPVISEPFVPQRTFTEKTVTRISTGLSDDEGTTTIFKKRKFGNRNVRRRFEDD